MDPRPEEGPPPAPRPALRPQGGSPTAWVLFVLASILLFLLVFGNPSRTSEISYGKFQEELHNNNVIKAEVRGLRVIGELKNDPSDPTKAAPHAANGAPQSFPFVVTLSPLADHHKIDDMLLSRLGDRYTSSEPPDYSSYVVGLCLVMTVVLLVVMWLMFRRARDQVLGGGCCRVS